MDPFFNFLYTMEFLISNIINTLYLYDFAVMILLIYRQNILLIFTLDDMQREKNIVMKKNMVIQGQLVISKMKKKKMHMKHNRLMFSSILFDENKQNR